MRAVATGWELDVERGPDWLIVQVRFSDPASRDSSSLADQLWALLDRHFIYRLVLDVSELRLLTSRIVDQLLLLDEQIHEHGGVMRLCGMSTKNQRVLRRRGLVDRFPSYGSVQEAVMGCVPNKPR
jgi:anti-anti-sigma regulatory factor